MTFKDVLDNYFLPETLGSLVRSSDKERELCDVRRGDVFLTRTSETQEDLGMSSVSLRDYPGATFNGFTKRLRPKDPNKVVPEYAAYYLRSPSFRAAMNGFSSLSTRASLNNDMLGRLQIVLPDTKTQERIGQTLRALDDKIEQNRRTGRKLEELARAVFKAWFVDFEPVKAKAAGATSFPSMPPTTFATLPTRLVDSELGQIPEGWTPGMVADICSRITSGGTPRTEEPSYWNGNLPWLSSGETRSPFIIETEKKITEAGVANSSTRLVRAGCTVIASAGQGKTRGQTSLLMIDSYVNQSVLALEANERSSDCFLFLSLRPQYEELRRISDAHSSRGSLTRALVGSVRVTIPPPPLVAAFDSLVAPMFNLIRSQLHESCKLAALRDYLLPRLLSGKVRVRDAEAQLERAL